MTQRYRLFAFALVVLVATGFSPVLTAHAQPEQPISSIQGSDSLTSTGATSINLSFEEMGFREDRTAAGSVATLRYDLPVARSWEPVSPVLNLHFSHSNLLLPDLSQMTVSYNDVPISDVRLTLENSQSGWLRVTVPANTLKVGRHQLKISFYQRLTRENCGDSGTEAGLWTVIHKDSTVTFNLGQKPTIDLSWFPEPFAPYGREALHPVHMMLVLPAQPNASELRAAGLVMAKLGQLIGKRNLNFTLSLGVLPPTGHAVVVAQSASATTLVAQESELSFKPAATGFSGTPIILADEGLIQLNERGDKSGLLLVSGVSDLALTRAALALADGDSLRLMAGRYTIVQETPKAAIPPRQPNEVSTLKELTGAGDQRVEGINVEELRYCFRLPPNWTVENGTQLDLRYGFSPNLWAERSSLSVRLNNTTVANVKLIADSEGTGILQIPLPADRYVDGYNCLRFLYTLRLEQSECSAEMGGELWAEIDSQSTLFLPRTIDSEANWLPDMDQYPYPFSIDHDLSHTTIVLPAVPSDVEIEGALRIAMQLGSEVRHESLQITIKTAATWEQESDSTHNLILIGGDKRNTVSTGLNDRRLTLHEGYETTLDVRQQIMLRQQSGAALAVAELLNSPWTNGQAILQLSSNSDLALTQLFALLTRNVNEEPFKGNLVTVTEGGLVRSVDTLDRSSQPRSVAVTAEGVVAQEPESPSTIRWFLIGGAVLLVAIVLLLILLTIRERRRVAK